MSNTNIKSFPDLFQCFPNLLDLSVDGCKNLEMLPELPRSLEGLNADDCHSLKKISGGIFNPNSVVTFANCVNLDETSVQDVIQRWSCELVVLPGEKVPPYFDHRSSGSSLTVKLGEMPRSPLLVFEPCILLADQEWCYGEVRLDCCLRGSHGVIIRKSFRWNTHGSLSIVPNHLCILGCALLHKADNPAAELPFNHVVFKFHASHAVDIKECGVRLFEHSTIPPDEWLIQPFNCGEPISISSDRETSNEAGHSEASEDSESAYDGGDGFQTENDESMPRKRTGIGP
ncbi:PREDICTED: disease resistance protein RML1B-like [Tarenaya hassleriana]|uniref:disease resistance protein RML1B-like n=1 Tax=Tarenaya hassleriana TaxID=28532 RepID=UPI0008FD1145|nr:PREDICTED: disease resistance protein RML1B-like [Tarenaya hassleriana]